MWGGGEPFAPEDGEPKTIQVSAIDLAFSAVSHAICKI